MRSARRSGERPALFAAAHVDADHHIGRQVLYRRIDRLDAKIDERLGVRSERPGFFARHRIAKIGRDLVRLHVLAARGGRSAISCW